MRDGDLNTHGTVGRATVSFPSPRPSPLGRRYVFSVGFREAAFQRVVARASRPCVGCTIRTGGTPVPLLWNRGGRSNFVCLTACRALEWLNTYVGRGRIDRRLAAIPAREIARPVCAAPMAAGGCCLSSQYLR